MANATEASPIDAASMSREQVLTVLREHNAWRRGADGPQTDPRTLGLALDAAIAMLGQQNREPSP